MTEPKEQDLLRRAMVNLSALRGNLPKGYVGREYVDMYHQILAPIEQAGYDIDEWRIPPTAVSELEDQFLRARMDAVLSYFSEVKDKEIGFHGPRK